MFSSSYITICYVIKVMAFVRYKLRLSRHGGRCDLEKGRSDEEGIYSLTEKHQNICSPYNNSSNVLPWKKLSQLVTHQDVLVTSAREKSQRLDLELLFVQLLLRVYLLHLRGNLFLTETAALFVLSACRSAGAPHTHTHTQPDPRHVSSR